MNVLDHNIPRDQAERLRDCRIHFRHIGFEIGRPEWDDQQEILRFLHQARQVTFFTRDLGFFRRRLCHRNYCLVTLTVPVMETAAYIRRLLRHSALRTKSMRQGKVIKAFSRKNRPLGSTTTTIDHPKLVTCTLGEMHLRSIAAHSVVFF